MCHSIVLKPVTNVTIAAPNLPVEARLQNSWQTWLDLGAGPKVVQILKEGYSPPEVPQHSDNTHRGYSVLFMIHIIL